jgi:hypothetical protein
MIMVCVPQYVSSVSKNKSMTYVVSVFSQESLGLKMQHRLMGFARYQHTVFKSLQRKHFNQKLDFEKKLTVLVLQ